MQSYAQLRTKTVQKYKQVDTCVLDRRYKVQVQEVQVVKSKVKFIVSQLSDFFLVFYSQRRMKINMS